MAPFRLNALFYMFSVLLTPSFSIFLCSRRTDVDRSIKMDLIDNEFEDCGFEGPLLGVYDRSPISEMVFDFSKDGTEDWLNFLISPRAEPGRAWAADRNTVREITLKGYKWNALLPLVEHAFSKMYGLEKVHWEIREPVTEKILRSLESNNPNCKLYYGFDSRDGEPSLFVANSSLLYALKADISYGYKDNYVPMDFVFSALSRAPNIRELDLYLHADGCECGVGNPWAFPFLDDPSVKFPALEVLRLEGYDLDERSDGGIAWSWRGKHEEWDAKWKEYVDSDDENAAPPERPPRPEDDGRTNLEAWMDAMDWSNLNTLHIGAPSAATLEHLRKPALPALKNISITAHATVGATPNEIISFVTEGTTNLLYSISLQKMGIYEGDTLLQKLHTKTLTTELRHFSYGAGGVNSIFLNQSKISTLLAESPKLEHLDINVPRKLEHMNTPDFDMSMESEGLFKDILSHPRLKHLTLRFPSPDHYFIAQGVWQEPFLGSRDEQYSAMRLRYNSLKNKDEDDEKDALINYDTVSKLYEDMRKRKGMEEQLVLEFYVGDWENRFSGGLLPNYMVRVAHWKCCRKDGCRGEQTRIRE